MNWLGESGGVVGDEGNRDGVHCLCVQVFDVSIAFHKEDGTESSV